MKIRNHGAKVGLFGQLTLTPGDNQVEDSLWARLKNVQVPTKHGPVSYAEALIECGQLELVPPAEPPPIEEPTQEAPPPPAKPKAKPKAKSKKRAKPRKKAE